MQSNYGRKHGFFNVFNLSSALNLIKRVGPVLLIEILELESSTRPDLDPSNLSKSDYKYPSPSLPTETNSFSPSSHPSRRNMARQNMMVPESVAQCLPPRSVPAKGLSMKRKLIKQLEIGSSNGSGVGNGRINSWFEVMKASSPTHTMSAASATPTTVALAEAKTKDWLESHPSGLEKFEEILKLSKGKQIVMFLDYDGTLSPIVDDPDRAFMSESMRAVVRDVARYFPTAIVSGRCRDKVYNFVRLAELYYAGSHGMDIKGPAKGPVYTTKDARAVLFQPASEFVPMIDELCKILVQKTSSVEGVSVENNKFCLSVHYRRVDEKSWGRLADEVRAVLKDYPKLKLTQGRMVLEIRPTIKWDKGKALEFLLESLGFADCSDVLPVYIGDDRTDEDAFKVLRERGDGIGILVSKMPKETNASYSLQEPSEVMDFLHRLVEWKKR